MFVSDNMKHMTSEECWTALSQGTAYKNAVKVLNLLRIFPASNAVLERCFSAMTKVKNDWCNRLGEQELEHLIRLKKEGPFPGTAAASSLIRLAADKFFKTKPRRGEVPRVQ